MKRTIIYTSKEFTSKVEEVKFKEISDAISLDEATNDGTIEITPIMWYIIHMDNEKIGKEYDLTVVVDGIGEKYYTGSESFRTSLEEIWDDVTDGDPEVVGTFGIKIFKKPSKNYSGKGFITCVVA